MLTFNATILNDCPLTFSWSLHSFLLCQVNMNIISSLLLQYLSNFDWIISDHTLFLVGSLQTEGSNPGLRDLMDCSLPGSSVHEDSPGKSTGVDCHALLQGIFSTQGSNPGLPHSLQVDSLPPEPPRKLKNTGVGSLSLLQRIFPIQESNQGLLHCRQILYQLSYQGSPAWIKGVHTIGIC